MDRAEAIKAMKSLQDNLGVDRSEENLTTEAATHDKRTETHGVCSDLISRADIEYHTQLEARGNGQYEEVEVAYKSDIDNLPPADTDMSEYSDKLWKAAYERGKAEGSRSTEDMDYCNNCPYISWDNDLISRTKLLNSIDITDDNPWDTDEVVVLIENAPGAWISVSDGLPKVKQEVYVTVYFSEGDTGRAYGYIDGFGNWHLYSAVEGTLFSGYEVTAWMPLPEPYKGGEDE